MASSFSSNAQHKLKIGFLTSHDPADRRSWSGIMHYLAASLAKHAGEVIFLGPAATGREQALRNLDSKIQSCFSKAYNINHCIYQSSGYANIFHARLKKYSIDVIFAPVASTEIALLKTSTPIVYMSDTTFAAINGYYSDYSNFLTISQIEANLIERLAIRKAAHLIYPSQWAANSAINDYGADGNTIHVFPMGANIDAPPTAKQIAMKQRCDHLRMLFVGVDWERKGGSVAFEALKALEIQGIPVSLTIVGCIPPAGFFHPKMKVIPFLNKNVEADRQQLEELYLNSDIFLLPTRAECMGIVFCEAAAFGLPSFTYATGGIPAVVESGRTGCLFPLHATGTDYADTIARIWQDPLRMNKMVVDSYELFSRKLSWDAWGKSTASVLLKASGKTKSEE